MKPECIPGTKYQVPLCIILWNFHKKKKTHFKIEENEREIIQFKPRSSVVRVNVLNKCTVCFR